MDIAEIFETLSADRVRAYVTERQEEHLLLDFKTVERADLTSSSDKRNLARALAGFANASGGVIVWGVDARKTATDGPDCACGIKEIEPLTTFVSRLNEFTSQFVRPTVGGVLHRTIPVEGDHGFAATYVPESDATPHMALGGESRYVKRSGSSFLTMEHYEVADMFGRRQRPLLELQARPGSPGDTRTSGARVIARAVILSLHNIGRATARDLYLRIHVEPPYFIGHEGLDHRGAEGLPRLVGGENNEAHWGAGPERVLHPGMGLDIAALGITLALDRTRLPECRGTAHLAADGVPLHAVPFSMPVTPMSFD